MRRPHLRVTSGSSLKTPSGRFTAVLNAFKKLSVLTDNKSRLNLHVAQLLIAFSLASAAVLSTSALAKTQQAPNSRVVLDLPESYRPSNLFAGFQNDSNGVSFVVLEVQRDAYDKMKAGFTAESLGTRGITNVQAGTLKRTGDYAYMRAKQTAAAGTYAKFFVLFPTADQTILISVNVPEAAITSGEIKPSEIEAVLASAKTVATSEIKNIYELGYLGPFKEAGTFVGTSKIYTPDGRVTPEKSGQIRSTFIVAPSIDKRQIGDPTALSKKLLASLNGYTDMKIQASRAVMISDLKGIEVEATALDEDTARPTLLVQTLLVGNSGGYFRMIGIAPDTKASALKPEFRKMAESFKLMP